MCIRDRLLRGFIPVADSLEVDMGNKREEGSARTGERVRCARVLAKSTNGDSRVSKINYAAFLACGQTFDTNVWRFVGSVVIFGQTRRTFVIHARTRPQHWNHYYCVFVSYTITQGRARSAINIPISEVYYILDYCHVSKRPI